jgi:hypothetical protein
MSRAPENSIGNPLAYLRSFESEGVLLDTNLLVIYLVAIVDRNLIGKVKRTENFLPEDAIFLFRNLPRFARRFTTPGIWAETSNLLTPFFRTLPKATHRSLHRAIRDEIAILDEQWVPAKSFAHDEELLKYGFTDLAIASLAGEKMVVLTADLPLVLLLQRRGLPCVNFNTLRFLRG